MQNMSTCYQTVQIPHTYMLPNRLPAQDPPFMYVEQDASGAVTYRGYLMDLWEILVEELQLRYRVLPQHAGGYGALLENGTWSGIIGQLAAKVSLNMSRCLLKA